MNRKTMKGQSFPLLEEVLFIWLLQQREANIIVPTDVLRAKAESMFRELQNRGFYVDQSFAFSDGWMRWFRNRFGLQVKRVAGEKTSVDKEAYLKFKVVFVDKLVSLQLKMYQVYNADESVLFIKMLEYDTVPPVREHGWLAQIKADVHRHRGQAEMFGGYLRPSNVEFLKMFIY